MYTKKNGVAYGELCLHIYNSPLFAMQPIQQLTLYVTHNSPRQTSADAEIQTIVAVYISPHGSSYCQLTYLPFISSNVGPQKLGLG